MSSAFRADKLIMRVGAVLLSSALLLGIDAAAFAEEHRQVISIADIMNGSATSSGSTPISSSASSGTASVAAEKLSGVPKLIADYLRDSMGLNSAAISGVLANIQSESEFDPNAVGDNNTSYGLCQWKDYRKTRLLRYCSDRGLDAATVSAQLEYLNAELTEYYPETLKILKGSRNNSGGADNAAYFFCTDYEAPAEIKTEITLRCSLAKNYYNELAIYDEQEVPLSQIEAELIAADFLRNEMKLNAAVTAGIMANILDESGFDPKVIGDRGAAGGICQWTDNRLENLKRFCKRNSMDENQLYSQLAFLKEELSNDYSGTMALLKECPDTLEGAKKAAYIFCKNYEVPKSLTGALRSRTKVTAEVYYPMLVSPLDDMELIRAASDRAAEYVREKEKAALGSICPDELEAKLLSGPRTLIYSAPA